MFVGITVSTFVHLSSQLVYEQAFPYISGYVSWYVHMTLHLLTCLLVCLHFLHDICRSVSEWGHE